MKTGLWRIYSGESSTHFIMCFEILSKAITERIWSFPPHCKGSSSQLPFSPACSASFCFGTSKCKNTSQWFHFLGERAERKLQRWASSATLRAVPANWQLEQFIDREGEERSCDSRGQVTCPEEVKTLTWYLQRRCSVSQRCLTHRLCWGGQHSQLRAAENLLSKSWMQFQTRAPENAPLYNYLGMTVCSHFLEVITVPGLDVWPHLLCWQITSLHFKLK